jgi:MtrB/PioB family decaheme-associated outer membrane protein
LLDGARLLDLSLRRDKGAGTLTYTPANDWDVQLQYSREKQTGYRQFGTTTNSFTNVLEMPEPIDYRTHQVKLGTEYGNGRGGFQAGYSGSVFSNETGVLVWDNPFRETDAVSGASRGRLDLYPDNAAHNLNFAGAVNIPYSTRFMASVVPGWVRQNDSFLPFTINTAIPGVPALPAASLGGSRQTLAMNYTLTSKAIPSVPLTLRYRSYDSNNNTPSLLFSQYVVTDGSLSTAGIARRSLPYGFDRKTLGLDATWEFLPKSTAKFLYEWERFNREHRDVERSDEHTVGTALDLNPRDWLLLRASYRHSDRDPEHYEPNEESFPLGEPATALGQLHSLRKFDEAARRRHRAETLLQITPLDQVSFGASYGTTQDDYDERGCSWLGFDQCYGLLKDINYNYTFEFTFNPHSALALFAEYTREKFKYRQRSRQRTPASATAPANDGPNNDWESDRRDRVDTWATGLDGSVSEHAIYSLFYSLSVAKNTILTRALGSPGLPGFLVTTAQDYPDTSNRWHQLVASIKFPIRGGLSPKLEYRYEKYDRVDFQLVNVGQYFTLDPSTATSVFLGVGADVPGYHAHILSVSLEYRF